MLRNSKILTNEIKEGLNEKHLCLWDRLLNTDSKDVNSL